MAVAQSRCTMQRPQRPQTQGCVIVLAQSFARCETNRASTIRQPRPTSTTTNRHSPAFWCSGRANSHGVGKARMPYKMNAQSFKQGCLKPAALSCHTMWQLSAADEAVMRNQQSVHKKASVVVLFEGLSYF